MGNDKFLFDAEKLTIYAHFGPGWQIVLDQIHRRISRQPKVFGLRLPWKRHIPYSQVARVSSFCRESWQSRANQPLPGWVGIAFFGIGSFDTRQEMPSEGWRYDIVVTLKSGETIKMATVKDPDVAHKIERQLRQRLGLPEIP